MIPQKRVLVTKSSGSYFASSPVSWKCRDLIGFQPIVRRGHAHVLRVYRRRVFMRASYVGKILKWLVAEKAVCYTKK